LVAWFYWFDWFYWLNQKIQMSKLKVQMERSLGEWKNEL
jgi:hypothetical protein